MTKKSEIIKVYRQASPRLKTEIDIRSIAYGKLKKFLKAGWKIYSKDIKTKPEPIQEKRGMADLTEDEIKAIKEANGSMPDLAEKFNVTFYAIRKIRTGK